MGTFVRRSTSRAALAALAAAAASLSLGAAAQAAPPSLPPQATDHGDFYTLSGKANDKAATIERLERALDTASPGVARQARHRHAHASIHGSGHLTGYRSKAVMCSTAYAKFDDTISHPFLETSATVSGSSRTAWLGNCPYNANTVKLNDESLLRQHRHLGQRRRRGLLRLRRRLRRLERQRRHGVVHQPLLQRRQGERQPDQPDLARAAELGRDVQVRYELLHRRGQRLEAHLRRR